MQSTHITKAATMDTKALLLSFSIMLNIVAVQTTCPTGQTMLSEPANCGRGGTQGVCPCGHYCNIAPNDAYAVCCSEPVLLNTTICPNGQNQHAGVSNCGRGGTQGVCPCGFYCNIAPNDAYAVCCSIECPNVEDSPLVIGGSLVSCGAVGLPSGACPSGFSCHLHPADHWTVCCPSGSSPLMVTAVTAYALIIGYVLVT